MVKKYKVLKRLDTVNFGERFAVLSLLVEMPNGKQTTFYMRETEDFSIIIPELDKERIFMVEQHRLGAGKISLEFPMGVAHQKGPLAAAKQELKEETGYTAEDFRLVGSFAHSPGWSNQSAHIFIAKKLTEGTPQPEETEFVETRIINKIEIPHLIQKGVVFDSATIAAYYLYLNLL
ncbi:NUDIX hydrolase [Candidatus Roizmanbacteria bacterium]|nr:NUDIX hydrolase [Candidatus Roizmanbacteria bacterium]